MAQPSSNNPWSIRVKPDRQTALFGVSSNHAQALLSLWAYRRFILGSVAREFRSRYARTTLGALWLLAAPFAMILVYTLVFSQLMHARLPGNQEPFAYSIYLCAGLLPWQWFTELVSRCVGLFVDQGSLIKKSKFPRMALPLIAVLSTLCNFVLVAGIFLLFLLVFGRWPGWSIFSLVPVLFLQTCFAVGLGLSLGVLNVFFRDIGQAVGIFLQFWFWLTPIIYPIATLPAWAREYLAWNPLLPAFEAYHTVLLGQGMPQWDKFWVLGAISAISIAAAVWIYRAAQSQMTDEL